LLTVCEAKGGGHGSTGLVSTSSLAGHTYEHDEGSWTNNSYAINRSPSIVFTVLDPYALESILINWSATSKELKCLIVLKVMTGVYAFYYVGLLLFHLLCRSPMAECGLCEIQSVASTDMSRSADKHVTLVLNLSPEIIELDHKMRRKKGFVGEIQIFSKVHALGDKMAEVQEITNTGETTNNVGPIGTLKLDGIQFEDAESLVPLNGKTGKVLWFPHRGGLNDNDYAAEQEEHMTRSGTDTREKFSVDLEFALTPAGQLTVVLHEIEVHDRHFYQWPFNDENHESFQWVLKNEGRHSPLSSWVALMPLLVLFDETLLFGEVVHLGNGQINPYSGEPQLLHSLCLHA
jgi:hypothetical protein